MSRILNFQVEIDDDSSVVAVRLEGKELPAERMPNGAMWRIYQDVVASKEIFVEENYY